MQYIVEVHQEDQRLLQAALRLIHPRAPDPIPVSHEPNDTTPLREDSGEWRPLVADASTLRDLAIGLMEPDSITPEQDLDNETVDRLAPSLDREVMRALLKPGPIARSIAQQALLELARQAVSSLPPDESHAVRTATGQIPSPRA